MRLNALTVLLIAMTNFPGAKAQEGYPLDGTWRGEWIEGDEAKSTLVIVLGWNGAELEGTINPGRNALMVKNAVLDPASWRLHLEALSKDDEALIIDGVLENIGDYNRSLHGTLEKDGVEYPFSMSRE